MQLGQRLHDEMVEYARRQLPREAVALLWGENDRVSAWSPMRNLADGCAAFRMDATEFEAALASAPAPLLAVMHSHPTEPPVPSTSDLAGATAWRSVVHLILSFADGASRFRAWRLFDGQALPVPLHFVAARAEGSLCAAGSSVLSGATDPNIKTLEGTAPWI